MQFETTEILFAYVLPPSHNISFVPEYKGSSVPKYKEYILGQREDIKYHREFEMAGRY